MLPASSTLLASDGTQAPYVLHGCNWSWCQAYYNSTSSLIKRQSNGRPTVSADTIQSAHNMPSCAFGYVLVKMQDQAQPHRHGPSSRASEGLSMETVHLLLVLVAAPALSLIAVVPII